MAEEEAPKAWSFADQNKDEQAVALAALVLDQCGEGDDKFAPEKFEAVLKAAGLSVAPHWVSVFSKAATLAGDLDCMCGAPGSGGGGGGGGGGGAAAAEEEKKEEEEEIDMAGGMDMFGGEGGGDDY